jgi:hypothetical protein
MYIISRIASVLKIKIQTNHASCLLPAALHKATPFHGRVQRIIRMTSQSNRGSSKNELNGSNFVPPSVDCFQSTYYHSVPIFEFWLLSARNEGFQLFNTILEFALGYKVVGRDIFVLYFLQIFMVYRDVL